MKQIVDKLNDIAKAIDPNVTLPTTNLITDSLDAITKAYGGTSTDSDLIVDKLEDIAGVAHGGITPQGKITITENGTDIDVAQYRTADVDVSGTVNFDGELTLVNNLDSGAVLYGYVGEDGTFKEKYPLSLGASKTINVPTETSDDRTFIKCLILLYTTAQSAEYTITPSSMCFVKYTWDTGGYVPVYVATYGNTNKRTATLTFTTKH